MLLRRIVEHVNAQNWTAVLLDFLIVVVGVFIGIEVANWNEVRQTRSEEAEYLQRLHRDLSGSAALNEFAIAFMARQTRSANLVLESLAACRLDAEDQAEFANGLYHIQKAFPPQQIYDTIDELKSTGKLAYISNPDIRKALNVLLGQLAMTETIVTAIVQRGVPHTVYIESQIEYHIDAPVNGGRDIAWEDITLDFDALCNDLRFRRAVSNSRRYVNDLAGRIEEVLAMQRGLIEMLEEELRGAGKPAYLTELAD